LREKAVSPTRAEHLGEDAWDRRNFGATNNFIPLAQLNKGDRARPVNAGEKLAL